MNLTLIAAGIAFVVGLTMGGAGVKSYYDGVIAREKVAQEEAQAKLQAQIDRAKADAANKLIDMAAAYDAGESKAKVIYRTIEAKGLTYVAQTPAFANPACVIGDDGLLLLNSSRANLRTASDSSGVDGAVRATGANTGRQDVNPVSANPAGQRPVGTLPAKP